MEAQEVPALGHAHKPEPERPGLHAAIEGEEEHHEKKPVLKKVKDKVNKIKDTISKKKHGHGGDDDDSHDQDQDVDVEEDEDGYEEDDDERRADPEVHGAAAMVAGHGDVEKAPLKDFVRGFEEDPAAPKAVPSAQIEETRGGEEIGTSPVIQAFEAMTVSDQPPPVKQEASEGDKLSEELENRPSYTGKISATTKTACEKVAEAGADVMEKVQQGGSSGVSSGVRVKLVEKLKPGEEDKALCQVISDAIRKRKEAVGEKVAVTGSDIKGEGAGVMGRLKSAVASWVGRGRDSRAPVPLMESQRKELEERKGSDRPAEEKDLE